MTVPIGFQHAPVYTYHQACHVPGTGVWRADNKIPNAGNRPRHVAIINVVGTWVNITLSRYSSYRYNLDNQTPNFHQLITTHPCSYA